MKKIYYGFSAAFIIFLSISCKKSNPIDCAAQVGKVTAAQSAYVLNDNKENCEAYKKALQDYLSGCGSSLSSSEKQSFQDVVDNMNCP